MDEPGPEHFGDETDLAKVTRVKEAAAIAFHKANQDLAVRAAALHRARVETEELEVGNYVYYWKPQTNKLDLFPMAWSRFGRFSRRTSRTVQQDLLDCSWFLFGSMHPATTTA